MYRSRTYRPQILPILQRPHTYGVRLGPWGSFATKPCRPTACISFAQSPSDHCLLITTNWSHTFSAKERDAETGLSYFGARYYSSDLSIWLSVDPMSDKYPSLSPYVYCADNPVKLVDPNGEEICENPYLLFNGTKGTLQIFDDNNTPDDYSDDTFIGEFEAHNNVASNSKGKWEDGVYEMEDKTSSHKHNSQDDSPDGSYGTNGCYRAKSFEETTTGKTRSGMAVHAGREYKDFQKRVTMGCVRTTPEAMNAIQKAIDQYGPLQKIIIQNNRDSGNSAFANAIAPKFNNNIFRTNNLLPVFRDVIFPVDKLRVNLSVIF